jgi:NADH-quinone oxidoreductase subunit J
MYFFFFLFAIVGVASAIMVITRRNVMHAALFLLLTFFCVGATYVLLRAELLAAVQVLVYAGSIAVILAGLTGLWMIIATSRAFGKLELTAAAANQPLGTPRAIGRALFTDYVLPFEIASIILLAAMIGAIYLARETAREEEQAPGQPETPALVETSEAD